MHENAQRPRATRSSALIAAAAVTATVAVVAGVIVGVTNRGGDESSATFSSVSPTPSASDAGASADPTPPEDEDVVNTPSSLPTAAVLTESLAGQEAIDALGDNIDVVARRNNKTVDELKDLLLRDQTAHVSTTGFIFYRDDFGSGS